MRMRPWLLAFHLLGVVLWMGGLLTLSRVLGYHAREAPSVRPRYTWLEGRLNYLVALPGAVLTVATGVGMAIFYGRAWFRAALWLHYKLALVAVVLTLHFSLTLRQRRIARQSPEAPVPRALFAAMHGTLGLLLIGILLLATHHTMAP
jgi:putative membrane protein